MMVSEAILTCPMDPDENDAGATSVRQYFKLLLFTLWMEGECFSGKHPFGNSGWKREVTKALVLAHVVTTADAEDDAKMDILITKAIATL